METYPGHSISIEREIIFFFVFMLATVTQFKGVGKSTAVDFAKAPTVCSPAVCSAGG